MLVPETTCSSLQLVQDFRQLLVWQRAHELAIQVRSATHRLRRSQYNSLRLQLIRAAESVPANIVEGCYASSRREFGRFLDISIKSCGELEYHLQLSRDYGLLPVAAWERLTTEATAVRRMAVALRRRVLAKASMSLKTHD